MNLYLISIISSLYFIFIHPFKNIFFIRKNKQKVNNRFRLDARKSKKDRVHIVGFDAEGYDNRYNGTNDLNVTKLAMFSQQLKKMQLIRLLENKNVSVLRKIDLINEYFPNDSNNYSSNLYGGNLINNFTDPFLFLGFD